MREKLCSSVPVSTSKRPEMWSPETQRPPYLFAYLSKAVRLLNFDAHHAIRPS